MDKEIADYFKAQAEELVQREYNEKSDLNKQHIDKMQEKEISDLKRLLNKEWQKEDQIITSDLKNNMYEQLKKLNIEIQRQYTEHDEETNFISYSNLTEEDVCKGVDRDKYPDPNEFSRAKRDVWREHQKSIRRNIALRRKSRIKLNESLSNIKVTETNKIQEEFRLEQKKIFSDIQSQRKYLLQEKITAIRKTWQKRENIKQKSINLKWETQKESMIIKYTKDLIARDKERLISHESNSLIGSVYDVNTIVNNRLTNEWKAEKDEKTKNKKKELDNLIRCLHTQIEKTWRNKIQTELERINTNLKNELDKINSISKMNYKKMRVDYKKEVLNNLRNIPIKIENNYENQNDYSRQFRDANRAHQNSIREEKKKFNDPEYIPDKLKSKIDIEKQTTEFKIKFIKNEYQHQIEHHKRESQISMEKEIRVLTNALKVKEIAKMNIELEDLEKKWKEDKKEECLLLSKVKYSNQLEKKVIHLDSIITQKNTKILELNIRNKELLREISNYRNEIQNLQEKIKSYDIDSEFIKNFRNKYIISKNEVKQDDKPKVTVVHRSQPIREPQNADELVEIMSKLLMKMTFRERGPIFEHKYIITGIYREEADLDIIIKSRDQEIVYLKYNHFVGEMIFKCGTSRISLPYSFEKDKFFKIELHFKDGKIKAFVNNYVLGTYELENPILTNIVCKLLSKKSVFYHQYVDQL